MGTEVVEPYYGPLATSHLQWRSRFQLYLVDGRLRVCRLPGEHFKQRCQAYRVQAGGGSVHVWGGFHGAAKSPFVLPDRYLPGELYWGILRNIVPFARQLFGNTYRYQDDNAAPHHAQVVLNFLQQGNVTNMEQSARPPDCNLIEHIWDELDCAITSMHNPPQNHDLRQALLDKWAETPTERLQCLVANMPRCLAAIISARGGNTRYWPGIHKTTATGSIMRKINFVCPYLLQLTYNDILVY